ncbi:hypothetical protein DVV95_06135 [Clostridium botulinum]|uniref:hypothetical protein n=1 Tax=Clostridium botulinum TaxID=1491 RepID=UPI001967A56A|nr:hypothetical protein [Clostridium botulinum]MBN1061399.1 hypothetical protein [Clostridium botulinum]
MNFLEVLDKMYEENRIENRIPTKNKEYRYYEEIKPLDFASEIRFECLKIREKTKILVCFNSSKIYLSDLDLLNIMLEMNIDEINWFIDNFIKVYNEEGVLFRFKINNEEFQGEGLPYKDGDNIVNIYSDNKMGINDFIFILNLIIIKDYLGTEQLKEKNKEKNLLKTTLCKYISLLKFYGLNSEEIKEILREAEYPIDKRINEVFSSYEKLRNINKIFENNKIFEVEI